MSRFLLLGSSHLITLALGFAAGIYVLPILIAPAAPSSSEITVQATQAMYAAEFRRDLEGSDLLHWGEGTISVGRYSIVFEGRLAPGPDYKLYLSPEFVETAADFQRLKPKMMRVGDVKSFERFIIPLPNAVNPDDYNTVVIWCESFSQFITAAIYR